MDLKRKEKKLREWHGALIADASPHVNDARRGEVEVVGRVGGLDSIVMAKGKSAVMNNVCKSEEGVKGGRE